MPSPTTTLTPVASVEIRLATPADAEPLALVAAATFLDSFAGVLPGPAIVAHCARHHVAPVYRDYLARPTVAVWLALATPGDAPVGYSMLTPPELPSETVLPGDLELKRIYALSRFHGTGLGDRLMEPAIQTARARHAPRLLLGVYAENTRALRFYARHGFQQVGTRTFTVGTLVCDDFVLARPL